MKYFLSKYYCTQILTKALDSFAPAGDNLMFDFKKILSSKYASIPDNFAGYLYPSLIQYNTLSSGCNISLANTSWNWQAPDLF